MTLFKDMTQEEFMGECLRIIRGEYTDQEREDIARREAGLAYEERPRPRIGAGTRGYYLRRQEARRA